MVEVMEYDSDAVEAIELDAAGAHMAVEAANDYVHAGKDPHEQLMQGIKAYLYCTQPSHWRKAGGNNA